jgi:hypothetical protein
MSTTLEPQVMPPTELALEVPKEVTALVADAGRFEVEANSFIVDSEASFQVADEIQASLKAEAKQIDDLRLEEFIRPLNKIGDKWNRFFSPAISGRNKAVAILQQKMRTFQREQDEKLEAARRKAEEDVRRQREQLEAEARKREEEAAKLKTKSAQERAMREAEEKRQLAALIPPSVTISASRPQTSASDERDDWNSKVREGRMRDALLWLTDHPEWWTLISFKTSEQKRFAKQFHNAPNRPDCFEFWNDVIYARKRS